MQAVAQLQLQDIRRPPSHQTCSVAKEQQPCLQRVCLSLDTAWCKSMAWRQDVLRMSSEASWPNLSDD